MKSLAQLIGLAFLVYGCGDSDGVSLVGACEDMAAAVADASVRCEDSDRNAAYESYIELAVSGSCNNVVAVRDNDALHNDCIPGLSTIECRAFQQGDLESACMDQLIILR